MTGINKNLIDTRAYHFGISHEQIDEVLGRDDTAIEQGLGPDPEQISLAQLGRLAELLHLHPADLIHDGPGPADWEQDYTDGMLAEFALAGAGGDVAGTVTMLGWSPSRLESATSTVYHSPQWSMGVADALALAAQEHGAARADGHEPGGYRAYFAKRTAPDPFDAGALLRVLHTAAPGQSATATGYADPAQARRLAAHALAVIDAPHGADPGPFTDSGFDTRVAVHPDLLYALDLAAAPGPSPADAPEPTFRNDV